MKKRSCLSFLIIISAIITVSCGQFHVKNEIRNKQALSKLKNIGIIIRIPYNSPITIRYLNRSLSNWLEPYKKTGNVVVIQKTSKRLNTQKAEYDRFMQFSSKRDFQYYQSVGIIRHYLDKNRDELEKIKNEHTLDSFLLYEIDGFISSEMQVYNFRSMIVIVDNTYKIQYMDHQFDSYDTNEIDNQLLRENLLDYISNRFLDLMMKLDYIDESD